MLGKLKLVRTALKKGITKEDINKDTLLAITKFGDLELICLYDKIIDRLDVYSIHILINSVFLNANQDNKIWLDKFIEILENKSEFISNIFSHEIKNLKNKSKELTYVK